MTSARDAFLQRVRQAVASGNRLGSAIALQSRHKIGYQGAGSDPVARFGEEIAAAGGQAHIVPDREAAVTRVLELVHSHSSRHALLGQGLLIDGLNLADRLRAVDVEVIPVERLPADGGRDQFFAADIGISGVDHLIAETGSVVLAARTGEPRSLSLLPPVHIVIAERGQLVPDLFDLFESSLWGSPPHLPSCLSLITGPSKTGDIELRLVTGVHGPGTLHVVVISA
jgi:L-lactate dehydrogenase complex protein LldG